MLNVQPIHISGQESDDEIKGDGNSVNYSYRMHDPRLGRFFAIDPLIKEYPHYTPYSFSGNKVIAWRELEGMEEILVIREQVDSKVYSLTYINDVTAESDERGEKGLIQYYDFNTGILEPMRATSVEERKNSKILEMLQISLTPKTKESTIDSYVTQSMGIQRTDGSGALVPYKQTTRNADGDVVGEVKEFYSDNNILTGLASRYDIKTFAKATTVEKARLTQPDRALQRSLDALADEYINGSIKDIKVRINTNLSAGIPGLEESNTMRRTAIINYLVRKGVNRDAIQAEPHRYDQPDYDSVITYDEQIPRP